MKLKISRLLLALVLVITIALPQGVFAENATSEKDIEYLKSVMDMIKEKYNGQITDKQLIEGAIKGMFEPLDKYSVYFSPEEADAFLSDMEGKYIGVGIVLSKIDNYCVASEIFDNSPAKAAGIEVGDKIVNVNGKSVVGFETENLVKLLRGQEGTEATVGIIKAKDNSVAQVTLKRIEIKLSPIKYEIKNDIGYIKIESFNANTAEFMTSVLSEMDQRNIKKIVLDLRYNTGGRVDQAVEVAKNFVPEGLITKLDYKSENLKDETYSSSLKEKKYKLAVLVNGLTASASEILAGAIQDSGAGTLIGTKTFGKAKVQQVIPLLTPEATQKYEAQIGKKIVDASELERVYNIDLKDEDILGMSKITVGQYTTPKGRMIDGTGIEPDLKIDDSKIESKIDIVAVGKLRQTVKPTLNSESTDVYNAELILKYMGYDVGTIDAKLDDKTYEAIKQFQRDNGLSPYGVLDFSTQKRLNEKLEKLLQENDKQYLKAVETINK